VARSDGDAPLKQRYSAPPAIIWICLCALSIVSVVQLEQGWSHRAAAILVVLIAAMKARLVITHYMEATRARRLWRFLYGAWTFAVAATIAVGYVLSLRS
jgi:Na+/citrate or Na+/malate symporter